MRPQNRVFRLFGVVIVTLCPAGSTQPVAASGVAALGAAATQIVSVILLTNVTRRVPAPPEGGGPEAAGLGDEDRAAAARGEACLVARAAVCPAAVAVVTAPDAAADAAADAVPLANVPAPRRAHPAASVTTLSIADVASTRGSQAGRRVSFPPNITSILPCMRSLPYRRLAAAPRHNRNFGNFRYLARRDGVS